MTGALGYNIYIYIYVYHIVSGITSLRCCDVGEVGINPDVITSAFTCKKSRETIVYFSIKSVQSPN